MQETNLTVTTSQAGETHGVNVEEHQAQVCPPCFYQPFQSPPCPTGLGSPCRALVSRCTGHCTASGVWVLLRRHKPWSRSMHWTLHGIWSVGVALKAQSLLKDTCSLLTCSMTHIVWGLLEVAVTSMSNIGQFWPKLPMGQCPVAPCQKVLIDSPVPSYGRQ